MTDHFPEIEPIFAFKPFYFIVSRDKSKSDGKLPELMKMDFETKKQRIYSKLSSRPTFVIFVIITNQEQAIQHGQ